MWRERETDDPNDRWWDQPDVPVDDPQDTPINPGDDEPAYNWLYDGMAKPPFGAPSGQEWFWNGRQWSTRNVGGTSPTTDVYNDPYPQGPVGNPRGGSGGGFGSLQDWPSYNAPNYMDPGEFDPGPAFTFREFTAPTGETMLKEPGFQFRMDQGRKALQASQFGKGQGLTGAAAKGIEEYGQNFASQEFGNVYNRALQEYDTNRNNAADIWGKAYGQRHDVYGARANNYGQQNTFNLGNATNDYNSRRDKAMDAFNKWKATGDWLSQPWE